ncbi:SurA N-terminal domain-containing protein [Streptomyces sp. KLOTTS4A1]|uniref:SurA N-terminal domain-containing protein n=1 Tax=Streptomyces sp. KLOTTS4A1 TaxID=3390996 RepID=UPI0039F55EBC
MHNLARRSRREAHLHRRRRTALTVSAALLVAAPLLAACSNDAHPGAAAVIGQERITMAQLQARVGEVRAAQQEATQESGEYAKAVENSGGLTRATLQTMVLDRILHEAAVDAGITVSRKEVQERRAEMTGGRGEEALESGYLWQFSVPPSQIDASLRTNIEAEKLYAALGADPQTQEGREAFWQQLSETARGLDIDINPRYGTWDVTKSRRADAATPWLRQVSTPTHQA